MIHAHDAETRLRSAVGHCRSRSTYHSRNLDTRNEPHPSGRVDREQNPTGTETCTTSRVDLEPTIVRRSLRDPSLHGESWVALQRNAFVQILVTSGLGTNAIKASSLRFAN